MLCLYHLTIWRTCRLHTGRRQLWKQRGMVRCDWLTGFVAFCRKGGLAFIAVGKKGRKPDRVTRW